MKNTGDVVRAAHNSQNSWRTPSHTTIPAECRRFLRSCPASRELLPLNYLHTPTIPSRHSSIYIVYNTLYTVNLSSYIKEHKVSHNREDVHSGCVFDDLINMNVRYASAVGALIKDAQGASKKKILKYLYSLNQELKLLLGALSLTKDFSEHF